MIRKATFVLSRCCGVLSLELNQTSLRQRVSHSWQIRPRAGSQHWPSSLAQVGGEGFKRLGDVSPLRPHTANPPACCRFNCEQFAILRRAPCHLRDSLTMARHSRASTSRPSSRTSRRCSPLRKIGGQPTTATTVRSSSEWPGTARARIGHWTVVAAPRAVNSALSRSTAGQTTLTSTRRGGFSGRSNKSTAEKFRGAI